MTGKAASATSDAADQTSANPNHRQNGSKPMAIEWGSETWGQPGHNVHHASDGSWLDSHNGERE